MEKNFRVAINDITPKRSINLKNAKYKALKTDHKIIFNKSDGSLHIHIPMLHDKIV